MVTYTDGMDKHNSDNCIGSFTAKKKRTVKERLRYVYVRVKVINGEYEYIQHCTLITRCDNIWFAAIRVVSTFYGGFSFRYENWFNFNGGEVACKLETYKELTKEEYESFEKIIH